MLTIHSLGLGCDKIRSIKNGLVTEVARGLAVSFRCNPGYKLFGPSRIFCNSTSWNPSPPQCKGKKRINHKWTESETQTQIHIENTQKNHRSRHCVPMVVTY